MKNRTLVLGAVVISLIAIAVVTFIFLDRSAKGQQKPIQRYSELPQIISNVQTLEIMETNLHEEGTTDAFVEIKIRNNSDKPIIAVNIESGDDKNASGKTLTGFHGDQPASAAFQPYETFQVEFPLSDVIPGFPIRIGALMYADGSEDGDEKILETMRRHRESNKNKKTEVSP